MNTNEHASYDVVLLPTYAEALSYRKRVAAEAGPRALFGVTVATFPPGLPMLWELFGDGRVITSPLEVEALRVAVLEGLSCGRLRPRGDGLPSKRGNTSLRQSVRPCETR